MAEYTPITGAQLMPDHEQYSMNLVHNAAMNAIDQTVGNDRAVNQKARDQLAQRINQHTHDDRYYVKVPSLVGLFEDSFTRVGTVAGSEADSGIVWTGDDTWTMDGTAASATAQAQVQANMPEDMYQVVYDLSVITATDTARSVSLTMGRINDLWAVFSLTSSGQAFVTLQKNLASEGTTNVFPAIEVLAPRLDTPQSIRIAISVLDGIVTLDINGDKRTATLTEAEVARIRRTITMMSSNDITGINVEHIKVFAGGRAADALAPYDHTHTPADVEGLAEAMASIRPGGHRHNMTDVDGLTEAIRDIGDGSSAYEIAVRHGFQGTEAQWVASLHGKDGSNVLPDQQAVAGALGIHSANAYGADPNADWETNRDAFQAANDAAYLAGGGRVTAIPGTYSVRGIIQDSHVEFYLPGVTLAHPQDDTGDVITARHQNQDATATAGSTTLQVEDATAFEIGQHIAVARAGGILDTQHTTLTANVDATQTTGITLADSSHGWPSTGTMLIGDELLTYTGISSGTLTGVTRGAYGTTPEAHDTTTLIGAARVLYATVTEIQTNQTLILSAPAVNSATDTNVRISAINPAITGARIIGHHHAQPVYGVTWETVTNGRITDVAVDTADGGIMLDQGTKGCTLNGITLHDCYNTNLGGAALWMFRGCQANTVTGLTITGKSWVGAYLDDRTTTATAWDAPNNENRINGFLIDTIPSDGGAGWNPALSIIGGNRNYIGIGSIKGPRVGVQIMNGSQLTVTDDYIPPAQHNEIASIVMTDVAVPWTLSAPGNILHDVTHTGAQGSPTTAIGNLAYASKLTANGPVDIGVEFQDGTLSIPGIRFANDQDTGVMKWGDGGFAFVHNRVVGTTFFPNQTRIKDGSDFEIGTTTGSRFGRTPDSRLGFWGKTPTTQPAAVPDTTGSTVEALETEVNKLKAILRQTGLMAD